MTERRLFWREALVPSVVLAEVCVPIAAQSEWERMEILLPSLRPHDLAGVLVLTLATLYLLWLSVRLASAVVGLAAGAWSVVVAYGPIYAFAAVRFGGGWPYFISRLLILIPLGCLIGTVLSLPFWLWRPRRAQGAHIRQDYSFRELPATGAVRGWLLVPAGLLGILPLLRSIEVARWLSLWNWWRFLRSSLSWALPGSAVFRLLLGLSVLLLVVGCLATWCFYLRKPATPLVVVSYLILALIAALVQFAVVQHTPPPSNWRWRHWRFATQVMTLYGGVGLAALGVPYFLISRRVRETFGRGGRKPAASATEEHG